MMRVAAVSFLCRVCPVLFFVPLSHSAAVPPDIGAVREALARSTVFLVEEVAYEGGYLGVYRADLSEGFGKLGARRPLHVNWLQVPGTQAMGFAFLEAWEATGDPVHLEAAVAVGHALARGQLASGGWYDYIDHSPTGERVFAYRRLAGGAEPDPVDLEAYREATGMAVHELKAAGNNASTFDDDITQSAIRLLLETQAALEAEGRSDAVMAESLLAAFELLLESQTAAGGWPQNFPSMQGRRAEYDHRITLNDGATPDVVRTLMAGYRQTGDERLLEAIRRAGEFFLAAQMPEPTPLWAQQYDEELQPAWGRPFEPPAVATVESYAVLELLPEIAALTGDARFLEPIDAAAAFYRRARLADGSWARFYEAGTAEPVYMVEDGRGGYRITRDRDAVRGGYSYVLGPGWGKRFLVGMERIQSRAEAVEAALAAGERPPPAPPEAEPRSRERLAARVAALLEQQDERGTWTESSKIGEVIDLRTVQYHMALLSEYLKAGAEGEER